MAMIFQDPMTALNPLMKVKQQIIETLKIHNTKQNGPTRVLCGRIT
ncbi:hypothetical protein ACFPFV_12335 [Salinicoccus siamensis]